jgi:hypothetical protein
MDGLRWGAFDHPLTPAFWVTQAWMAGLPDVGQFRLGRSLVEEVVYCLLGGYGIPAEVGVAAAERVCDTLAGASDLVLGHKRLEQMLSRPLTLRGRAVRYRFAAQRAKYLSGALAMISEFDEAALGDIELRNACE